MKLKLVLFSLFFALSLTASAQTPNLSINGFFGTQGVLDTIPTDSTIPFTYTITNTGTVPFAGEINVLYYLNNDSTTIYTLDSLPLDTLAASQTNTYATTLLATSVTFGGGVNILVIWPAATNATFDTLVDSFYVDTTTMANLPPELRAKDIQLYPNPARTQLHFNFGHAAPVPTSLTIRDLAGREVYFTEESFQVIDLHTFQADTYFLSMQFRNGQTYQARFVKF